MLEHLDPLYLAWLGGLIDGEGSFVLGCSLRKKGAPSNWSHCRIFVFAPVVVVKMHEREAVHLDELHETLGLGRRYHINKGRSRAGGESWQTTKTWEAMALSAVLWPHLRIKRRQAEVIIRACRLLDNWAADGGYNSDADRIWTMLQIRDELNPGTHRNRRRNSWTRAEVEAIVAEQIAAGHDPSRGRPWPRTITAEHLALLSPALVDQLSSYE